MERLTIEVGSYGVNCSILSADGQAWIVDPGQEGARILERLIPEDPCRGASRRNL